MKSCVACGDFRSMRMLRLTVAHAQPPAMLQTSANGQFSNNARRATRQLTVRWLVSIPFATLSGSASLHFCDAFLEAAGFSARFRFDAAFCASVRTLADIVPLDDRTESSVI